MSQTQKEVFALQNINTGHFYGRRKHGFTTPFIHQARYYRTEDNARKAMTSLNEFWRPVVVLLQVKAILEVAR